MIRLTLSLFAFAALSACGQSSQPNLGIINESDASITIDDDVLSLLTIDRDIDLPLNASFDHTSFVGAADLDVDGYGQIASASKTADTFAVLRVDRREGSVIAEAIYGRTTPIDALPSASAVFTGDYVGTWVGDDLNSFQSSLFIIGDATFALDLEEMVLSGGIRNRSFELSNLDFVFDQDIIFPTLSLQDDGTFSGRIDPSLALDNELIVTATSVDGVFGSDADNSPEVVGTVTTGNEVGVFFATPE